MCMDSVGNVWQRVINIEFFTRWRVGGWQRIIIHVQCIYVVDVCVYMYNTFT